MPTDELECDARRPCGHCDDCEDDDAPSAAELREHDEREYRRMVRESLGNWWGVDPWL